MKRTVSLVLSSGGARGVAHIGVIEELERQGFEIKSVAGTSIGALVGGMYASGNLEIFREWMCKLDRQAVFNLVDLTLTKNGLVKGNKIIKRLKEITPDVNIEDLLVSYSAIATDIKGKKEIVFEKNSLFNAIRASISIPGIFTPYILDEMVLIDGGVLNPLPVNRVKRHDNDLLIAVDVSAPIPSNSLSTEDDLSKLENEELKFFPFIRKNRNVLLHGPGNRKFNYYSLFSQSSGMMVQQISALTISIYKPDILIKIPINAYGSFQFYKSEEIIRSGELATRKELLKFQNKA